MAPSFPLLLWLLLPSSALSNLTEQSTDSNYEETDHNNNSSLNAATDRIFIQVWTGPHTPCLLVFLAETIELRHGLTKLGEDTHQGSLYIGGHPVCLKDTDSTMATYKFAQVVCRWDCDMSQRRLISLSVLSQTKPSLVWTKPNSIWFG